MTRGDAAVVVVVVVSADAVVKSLLEIICTVFWLSRLESSFDPATATEEATGVLLIVLLLLRATALSPSRGRFVGGSPTTRRGIVLFFLKRAVFLSGLGLKCFYF